MVTVRQFSRGVSRTMRAIERDAQRAQRQRMLQEKAYAKAAALDAAANAADAYQRLLDILTGCHRLAFARIDWSSTADAEPPSDPEYSDLNERTAQMALDGYRPGWFAKTFGLAKQQRAKRQSAIAKGQAEDADYHRSACEEAARRRDDIALARDIVALKSRPLMATVSAHANFDNVAIEAINVLAIDGRVVAIVDALELEDMPKQSVSLLQSGKASYKPLSTGRVLELHRDNICSAAVFVAAEFLRVIPTDAVEVIMETDLLDRGSGHITPQPVLYARITAQALTSVNLTMADPAPLTERLGAHMDWNRKDGFRPLDLNGFDLPSEILGSSEAA